MGDGGRQIAQLRHLAEQFPISVHGVGLSIVEEGNFMRITLPASSTSLTGLIRLVFLKIGMVDP